MKRVKKQKKRPSQKVVKGKEAWLYVKDTTILDLNCIIRTCWEVYGWKKKRTMDFLESIMALRQEVADGRNTIHGMNEDTKNLTGIDAEEMLNNLYK